MIAVEDVLLAANAPLRRPLQAARVEWIDFPSDSLPSLPSLRLEVPDGWQASCAPGALVVLGPPDVDAGVDVRIEWLRVASSTPVRDLAAAYFARTARRHPDVAVAVQKLGVLRERPVYLRGTTMTAADGRRVAQLQAFLVVPTSPTTDVADLFVVVGTCPEADAPRMVPDFVRLAASVETTSPARRASESSSTTPAEVPVGPADPIDPFDIARTA